MSRDGGGTQQASQAPWKQHHTVFTNAKAGMDGVDKDHVQRVVYEMSKDSAHFKNEQRKQAQTDVRIKRLQAKAAALTPAELAAHQRAMDTVVAQLSATRDLTSTWLVVDFDAFFASVEELKDPSLKHKPMAVGGIGMISTANYVARRFGVRSAMPGFIGRRLCPELVFARADFQKYSEVSRAGRAIFEEFDPDMQAASLDEAYLDATAYCAEHDMTGGEVAEEVRRRVRTELGVTCSIGVAPNRMLAKVCADRNKPDGQFVLLGQTDVVARFVDALPIRKVPGIGKVQEQVLKSFGITTCSDLIAQRGLLSALFSKVAVDYFMRAGLGLGQTQHSSAVPEGEVGRKGISCERTFAAISAPADLEAKLGEIAEHLAGDMAREELQGRTLTLKLKSATTFEVHTRAATLPLYVSSAEELYAAALKLLRPMLPITLRLMGIRVSHFKEQPAPPPGQKTLEQYVKHRSSSGQHAEPTAGGDGPLQPRGGVSGGAAAAGDASRDSWPAADRCSDGGGGGSDCGASQEELTLHDWTSDAESEMAADLMEARPPEDLELSLRDWQRPGSQPHLEPRTSQPTAKRQWPCRTCTYLNPPHLLRCELCDVPRGGPLSIGSGVGSGSRVSSQGQSSQLGTGGGAGTGIQSGPLQQQQQRQQQIANRFFGEAVPLSASDTSAAQPSAERSSGGGVAFPSSTDAAAASSDQLCKRCGKAVPDAQRAEHSDWHFAQDLQRGGDGAQAAEGDGSRRRRLGPGSSAAPSDDSVAPRNSLPSSGKSSRGSKRPPTTIDSLLSRHRHKTAGL